MQIHLFGKPHIIADDGQTVTLPTSKDRFLLAYVLVHGLVARSVLVDLFWPAALDGRRNLTQTLSVFRKQGLDDHFFIITRRTVQPGPGLTGAVDCLHFDHLLTASADLDHPWRMAQLTEAVALYQAPFAHEPVPQTVAHEVDTWIQRQRRHYHDAVRWALNELVRMHRTETGNLTAARQAAEQMMILDPLDDRSYRELMQIHAINGDTLRVVRLYDQLCRALQRELGIPPPAEVQAFYEGLVHGTAEAAVSGSTALDEPAISPLLPTTPLIGRAAVLADVACRITRGERCLILVGPGGVGKSRLALHVAQRIAGTGHFRDGVQVVELADRVEDDAAAVARIIAHQLQVPLDRQDDVQVQLGRFLRARQMLLVLDDMDGVHDWHSLLVGLVRLAPELSLLLTTRERVHLRDVQIIPVAPLTVPQTDDPEEVDTASAVQLFLERARRIHPDFALTAETLPHVFRICRLLDGLPLALELAAAWIGMFDCQTLADELARDLDLLSDRAPDDVPARHHGLRAVFMTSWQRLTSEQQRVLAAFAVCRSPIARDVARQITGASSATLAALVDTSLLRVGADQRLILPAPLRQYAAEQLGVSAEEPQVMQRHAQVMLQNLRDQTAALRGADQRTALHMVHRALPDIEAAWHWAVAQRDGNLLREAAPALFHVCDIPSDFVRGASLFGAAHTSLEPESDADTAVTWGMVASRYAWFRWHQGAQQEAWLLLEQARDVLAPRDTAAVVFAHNYLGAMAMHRQEAEQAITHCAAALAAAQHVGDRYGEAVASNIRAQIALEQDDLAAAQAWARQSFVLEQQLGNRWSSAYSLTTLGRIALVQGNLNEARRYLEGALDIRRELGDRRGQALCLGFLGDTLLNLEVIDQAADAYRAALARYRDLGNDRGVADIIARMVRCGARDAGQDSTLALIHDGLHAALRAGPPAAELARLLLAAAPLLREMDPALANDVVVVSKSRSTSWHYYSSQAWRVLAQTVLATS